MIDTFLFDLDGTLIDSIPSIYKAVGAVIKTLNLPMITKDRIKSLLGISFEAAYRKVYPDFMDKFEDAVRIYNKTLIDELVKDNKLFPSVIETLDTLKRGGIKVGIVTAGSNSIEYTVLRHYKIPHNALVTSDDTEETRPSPKPILLALERLNSRLERTIYIGDDMVDVLQGRNAKVKIGIVLTTHKKEDFETSPDYFFSKISDVLELTK
jgi:HAD superfamily hydrolase (TIGR01549 family)